METSTFVKQLSSNSRQVREKSLEALKQFLVSDKVKHSNQLQFDKLWKGLYYAMWFSDRPRPQQRLANQLGELYMLYFNEKDNTEFVEGNDSISLNDKAFIKFSKSFWKVLCIEWFNIDRFRMDKYLLMTRRILFNQFKYLQLRNWNPVLVEKYIRKVIRGFPLSGDRKVYNGIPIHVIDIFMDEWERLYTDEDDEAAEEQESKDDEKNEETIQAWVQKTPFKLFMEVFNDSVKDTNNSKVIRNKIKEDLFTDSRLIEWGFKEDEETESAEQENGKEKDSDTEEWHGF